LCSELGFLKKSTALKATYLTAILYLGSGVIGTLHHIYFAGTPTYIAAIGMVAFTSRAIAGVLRQPTQDSLSDS
jgi:nitric oxide reductase subunit B